MIFHKPVLLKETIEGLNIVSDGVYVDVTFGGGGHSKEILKKLGAKGRLIGFDQDEDAFTNALDDDRFELIRANFRHFDKFLRLLEIDAVDGILADLGVSSFQFDTGERGFSYRFESELDMRMNRAQEKTAQQVLKTYREADLVKIFSKYGEIRNSKQLARAVVSFRQKNPIRFVRDLEHCMEGVIRGDRNRYLAQVYQAIRIEVNEEMAALEEMLESSVNLLKSEGRLVVMSYHSIEDRMVKRLIKTGNVEGKLEKDEYGVIARPLREVVKGVILPTQEEMKLNPRSKSSKLRIAEKR